VAKKAATQEAPNDETQERGESVAGYFRKIFAEKPSLLHERSNDELYRRWMEDHPGHDKVPDNVKTGLQNVKSVLRQEAGKKKGKRIVAEEAQAPAQAPGPTAARARKIPVKVLEALEQEIDECLGMAKGIDREELRDVIATLREARNMVVRKHGGG